MSRIGHSILLLALLPACGQASDEGAIAATAPALGKVDSVDSASRSCEIILREVTRTTTEEGTYEVDCSGGECLFVWRGSIDVADTALGPSAAVRVLYRRGDGGWWDVGATPVRAAIPGYHRFAFAVSEHLFGEAEAEAGVVVEMVAYLALPGGARLFDHNRLAGDLENLTLTVENGYMAYDPGVCQPQTAHLNFDVNGGSAYNDLRQDGWILASFNLERLPACRAAGWDTVGVARFSPGGEIVEQSLRAFETAAGAPTAEAQPVPFMVEIPDDATGVELWFHNFAPDGCETWDSNFGANYRYVVRGAPGVAARCDGYTLSVANYTQPVCLGYDLAAQRDADACELHLDGIGHAYEGHYGIPHEWLETYVHAGATDGAVENAGLWVRFHDKDGAVHEQFQLGSETSPRVYKSMLDLANAYSGLGNTVEQLAFFVDVRRPSGQVERFWQSRHGANYAMADAFTLPTTSSMIPYGHAEWANDGSAIFDSRNACE